MARTLSSKGQFSRSKATAQFQEKQTSTSHEEVATQTKRARSSLSKNFLKLPSEQDIRIFQIYYEDWHRELLDPAFNPLNNSQVTSELMEFEVFERLFCSSHVNDSKLWGALSWRYKEKTGITGAQLIKIIQANPDIDVYYCNPHVANEALFHNAWLQGEVCHPQLLKLSTALFDAVGLDRQQLYTLSPSTSWSAANYFVGSHLFWKKYLAFVRDILNLAEKKLDSQTLNVLRMKTADIKGMHRGATYLPFIIERLFSIFIQTVGKQLRVFKIPLPERERELNIHLKMLRDMKDVAYQQQSPWLAACWINYRNLYFTQFYGQAWCQRYLRAITPTEIRFA